VVDGGSRRRVGVAVGALVVVALVVAAVVVVLRGRGDDGSLLPTSSSGSPSASASPAPSPTPPPVSPFTGLAAPAGRPVLGVKIDNVRPARPPTGLTAADVVYVEPVEGGLSRLLAVFSSRLPDSVGPVRSARESDLELLRQFGHPALAFSGANRKVLRLIRAAPVTEVSPDTAGGAYRRSRSRSAPHNLFADPAELLERARGVTAARDIGFRFGALPAGGVPTTSQTVRYPAATTSFRWRGGRWLVSMDGRPATTSEGPQLAAATVVIQYVSVSASRFRDSAGNVTPYAHTVGSGTAVVLRDGVAIRGRWSRSRPDGGTTFTTDAGAPLTFAPGQVWVVLAARR
jgi:hypothetical protein